MSKGIYINGDSKNELKRLEKDRFKLIITSPPYNVGKEYEVRESIHDYLNKQAEIIKELVRVLHPQGSICWQVGNYVEKGEIFPLDIYYYDIFKDLNLKLRNRIIWQFGHGLHSKNRFSGRYETILWFTKSDDYTFNLDPVRIPSKYPGKKHYKGPKKGQYSGNPKGKNPSDVWEVLHKDWDKEVWDIPNVKANHIEKTSHPCQFPIELVDRFILALTDEGDEILDPFAGVGSTLISSVRNKRKALGIEKYKKYVKLGEDRLERLESGSLKIREMTRPIYDHTTSNLSNIPEDFKEEQ